MELPDPTEWLVRPTFGRREKWKSYLFMPFSPKLGQRVFLYTPDCYNHWVDIEWDVAVSRFNEKPPPVRIASEGRLHTVDFDMACVDISNRLFFRRLISNEAQENGAETLETAIDQWATHLGTKVERVNPRDFLNDSLRLENRKEILHLIHAAKDDPNRPSESRLIDYLSRNPGATIAQVQLGFSDFDENTVAAEIGVLLCHGRITANLSDRPIDRNLKLVLRRVGQVV